MRFFAPAMPFSCRHGFEERSNELTQEPRIPQQLDSFPLLLGFSLVPVFDEDSTATGKLDRPSSQGADCYLRRTEADLLAYSTCLKGCIAPQFPSR